MAKKDSITNKWDTLQTKVVSTVHQQWEPFNGFLKMIASVSFFSNLPLLSLSTVDFLLPLKPTEANLLYLHNLSFPNQSFSIFETVRKFFSPLKTKRLTFLFSLLFPHPRDPESPTFSSSPHSSPSFSSPTEANPWHVPFEAFYSQRGHESYRVNRQ